MINAEEARQKTILSGTKHQKKLYISTVKKINRKIKEATKKGLYGVAYSYYDTGDSICKLLVDHYENMGYKVKLIVHNMLDDEIYINWEEEA